MSAPRIINPATASGGIPVGGSGAAGYVAKWTAATTLGGSTTTGATASLYVDATGNVGIGTASPTAKLDVAYGDYLTTGAVRIGADVGANTSRTDATAKFGAISVPHFTNAAANAFLIGAYANTASTTTTYIGGGLGNMNASTRVSIYAGATSTTSPGTEIVAVTTAGLFLGSTAALVFNATGTNQGIKLPSAPGNTDAQTLDCYQENPLATTSGNGWTPTLSAAATWGGTQPNVTYARYVRMGSMVFCEVKLTMGAGTMTSTYGLTTIDSPFTTNTNASHAAVPVAAPGVSGVGFQSGTTVYLPTIGASSTFILTWSFFA